MDHGKVDHRRCARFRLLVIADQATLLHQPAKGALHHPPARQQLAVEVVRRCDEVKGFKVLPRRWVVERTFGWLMKQRRLVRDYEQTETSAAAMVHLAMIHIMLRRLA